MAINFVIIMRRRYRIYFTTFHQIKINGNYNQQNFNFISSNEWLLVLLLSFNDENLINNSGSLNRKSS